MTKNKRLKESVRKEAIADAALKLATDGHYLSVQRKDVAEAVFVTAPAITYHFGTMQQLRRAIMRAAIAGENLKVIAQGLVSGDEHAKKAPEALRRRALESLI